MFTIFAEALFLAARVAPAARPIQERPFDRDAEYAHRRFWLNYAQSNR